MSIQSEIARIQGVKTAIASAIAAKGVTVPANTALSGMPALIGSITGGGSVTQNYTIRFIDYDGTVLKTETVPSGGNATPPANPTRTGYTFKGWNVGSGAWTAVTKDFDICAMYNYTAADADTTEITLRVTPATGSDVTFYYQKTSNSTLSIVKDDNTSAATDTSGGDRTFTFYDLSLGEHTFKFYISSGTDKWSPGRGTNLTVFCGGSVQSQRDMLMSARLGRDIDIINNYAFYNCRSLTSVTIPDSVTSTGYYAFQCCYNLTGITIPNSVTSIDSYAFGDCTNLTNITIPNSVTSIGDCAFEDCNSLASITVPNSIYSIVGRIPASRIFCYGTVYTNTGNLLIDSSIAITTSTDVLKVTIPDGITIINNYAFYNCRSLTSVTIPDSVTNIGGSAFYNCSSLASITIPNSVTSMGWSAFFGCSGLTSITIGTGVTSLGGNTFYNCNSLTSITIPDSVTSIGNNMFGNCHSLKDIYLSPVTPPTLSNTNAFTNINTACLIHVPAASLAAYRAATNWSTYANYMVGDL